jgi:hypothetical protein
MKKIKDREFQKLEGMDVSSSVIDKLKHIFKNSIDSIDDNIDEMFDCLEIRQSDNDYFVKYGDTFQWPNGTHYFFYKFETLKSLIDYLKLLYCIYYYHKDLTKDLCDTIRNGLLDVNLHDDLIKFWAIQENNEDVLELLK